MGVNEVVVAVDGGGTKADAVAFDLTGRLVASSRGPGGNPQSDGVAASLAMVDGLIREVAGSARVLRAGLYLSGLDLPQEVTAYREAAANSPWAASGLDVDNDLFALLRAGTEEPDAVAVVCGTGINAVGIRADGATARFLALGPISGDWGGGLGLGQEALWYAARDVDGRGPHTALTTAISTHFGVDVSGLITQFHLGERSRSELAELAPAVFAVAVAGDEVAGSLVDRQAKEIVDLARAALTRLELTHSAVPIVLGGGILRAGDARLLDGIRTGLAEVAPTVRLVHVTKPPILGAALLTLAHAGADTETLARAQTALL